MTIPVRTMAALAAAAALTACAAPAVPTATERASSPLERRVLADGTVTRAEYEEAVRAYIACARAAGMAVEAVPTGQGYFRFTATDFSAGTDVRCSRGTRDLIEPRYLDTLPATRPPGRPG